MKQIKRRTFLESAVLVPVLGLTMATSASADGSKASQASMHYQTTPNGTMQCSGCKFFIAGSGPNADGTCQIVDGTISSHGYCQGYSAKSS